MGDRWLAAGAPGRAAEVSSSGRRLPASSHPRTSPRRVWGHGGFVVLGHRCRQLHPRPARESSDAGGPGCMPICVLTRPVPATRSARGVSVDGRTTFGRPRPTAGPRRAAGAARTRSRSWHLRAGPVANVYGRRLPRRRNLRGRLGVRRAASAWREQMEDALEAPRRTSTSAPGRPDERGGDGPWLRRLAEEMPARSDGPNVHPPPAHGAARPRERRSHALAPANRQPIRGRTAAPARVSKPRRPRDFTAWPSSRSARRRLNAPAGTALLTRRCGARPSARQRRCACRREPAEASPAAPLAERRVAGGGIGRARSACGQAPCLTFTRPLPTRACSRPRKASAPPPT